MIIVLEGLEGVGKTTLGEACANRLRAEYLKTPPKDYNSIRAFVASGGSKEANFYFYLSGMFLIQSQLLKFKKSKEHVLVDRYIHSTIAYHDQGRDLTSPKYQESGLIKADITIHITCTEDERARRKLIRGFHIYERPEADEPRILDYFRKVADLEFQNDAEQNVSVQSLCNRINEWLAKDVNSLREN